MDAFMMQYFLEDEDEEEFAELIDMCLPKTLVKNEDNLIYKQIQSACINLASRISKGVDAESLNLNCNESKTKIPTCDFLEGVKMQSGMSKRLDYKRKRLQFGHTTSREEASSEFIDSDIEDEQIQKFLRSRKKKRIGKKLAASVPDPRTKVMELRLFNHFENKSDEEFFHHLRVTKATYEHILDKIKEASIFSENYAGGNFPVQAEQALQMFLYYMGHRCTYKFLSQMYHISESAIMSSFMKCVGGINRLDDREVRWPSAVYELKSIQSDFKSISGLPGIIGSIGGCCVEMRTNKEPPAGYKIGKLRSIMYLLGVTDAQLRFIYIQAGFPGTFCLQEAFESSSLGEMMKTNSCSLFADENAHLIGNADFILHKHLMVPYPNTGILTDCQISFNEKTSKANVCEKAFTHLKGRFTSLQTQVYANLEKIPNIIKACCIIHNIALKDPNDKRFLRKNLMGLPEDYSAFRDDSDFIPTKPQEEAFLKRDAIAKRISRT